MYQIPAGEIAAIPSLPAKSAYMFVHQHVRDGVWPSLFGEHVLEFYEGKELNNARTNFPRRLSPDKDWNWQTYIETLVILSRAYKKFVLEITVSRDGLLKTYTVDIIKDRTLWKLPDATAIKNKPRQKDSLFMPPDTPRENETALTFIIRDTLRRDRLTIRQMNDLLDKFLNSPDNTHTFTKDDPRMQKSSILTTIKRGRIGWPNMPRLLKLFGYKSVSFKVTGKLGEKEYSSIVGLAL